MKSKLIEHLTALVLVTVVLLAGLTVINNLSRTAAARRPAGTGAFGDLSFVDFNSTFDRALLRDAINIYFPGRVDANDSLFNMVVKYQEKVFADKLQNANVTEQLSAGKFLDLLAMYGKFLLVYAIVMFLTWYGVQTLAVLRFTWRRGGVRQVPPAARWAIGIAAGIGTLLLFCPAYVIAYAIRTEFNTDTVVFMILLGTVSNGVLITYANKFYSFLMAESRKGYVDTTIVKNCNARYDYGSHGIPLGWILGLKKKFPGHVFDHIFSNARHQYLPTIKEQASFLISGLIIIEMALNIHGHLSYEMLRQLLYRNYSIVAVIILFIFYTVKGTELVADYLVYRENKRLES